MAKSTFNLMELINQRAREETKEDSDEQLEQLYLDIDELIPTKDNFYGLRKMERIKKSIQLVGILQPLLVVPAGGKYEIKAGHRRYAICQELVEEGEERYRKIPCVIKNREENKSEPMDNILKRLYVMEANSFRDKTDWERMEEALQSEELIRQLKKTAGLPGKVREILHGFCGISETQMGRYIAVKNNLSPELMEAFRRDAFGISVAEKVQALPEEYQTKAKEILDRTGALILPDIEELRNMYLDSRKKVLDTKCEPEKPAQSKEDFPVNPPELPEEPEPETIESICYSCLYWGQCGMKSNIATSCNRYKDKNQKTAEQTYSEEQDAIDRQTKRKLQEKQDEEATNRRPPVPAWKEHEIKLAAESWNDVAAGIRTFELCKIGYKVGDLLKMQEYKAGAKTGREIRTEITYIMEDYTGLSEGYCILGIRVQEVIE